MLWGPRGCWGFWLGPGASYRCPAQFRVEFGPWNSLAWELVWPGKVEKFWCLGPMGWNPIDLKMKSGVCPEVSQAGKKDSDIVLWDGKGLCQGLPGRWDEALLVEPHGLFGIPGL